MPLKIVPVVTPPILQDAALQQELDREGVVTFPFLSADALAALRAFYHRLHPTVPQGPIKGFYVSVHSANLDYKLEIQNEVNRIIHPFCEQNFKHYLRANTAMLVKSASPESELVFHQDWNATDETQFRAYTFWVPLIDTTIENGTLFVAKRTHRIGPTYRSALLPSIYSQIGSTIAKYLVPYEVKAGNAVLFDKSVLHQSPPNFGTEVRPTVVSTIIHQDARYLTYAFNPNDKTTIEAYEVAHDYLQYYTSFFEDSIHLPANAIKTNIAAPADFAVVTAEEFEQLHQALFINA